MKRKGYLKLIHFGADFFNKWREVHPATIIDLEKLNFAGLNLASVNFSKINMKKTDFTKADLKYANLAGANLKDAILVGANLEGANLTKANIDGANLNSANLRNADFTEAAMNGTNLSNCDATGASFIVAKMKKSNLREANLSGANIKGANLNCAYLGRANMSRAQMSDVDLSNANLREAIMNSTILDRADMTNADVCMADLTEAKMNRATLMMTNISESRLYGAELTGANLSGGNLHNSDLSYSQLDMAVLVGANLDGTNMHMAKIGFTVFGSVDLSHVDGLETIEHLGGPSSIGSDTLEISKGNIPGSFLRDAGLGDTLVDNISCAMTDAESNDPVFISYSIIDQEFANLLRKDLRKHGFSCWFVPCSVNNPQQMHNEMDAEVHFHKRFIVVMSEHNLENEWVKAALIKSRNKESNDVCRLLFPIKLVKSDVIDEYDSCSFSVGNNSSTDTYRQDIPDFSDWNDPDSYRAGLEQLLENLEEELVIGLNTNFQSLKLESEIDN